MAEMPEGPAQPFWGEIKQVQLLMLLLSTLPTDGKLSEALRIALAVPQEEACARLEPCPEITVLGLRSWLNLMWAGEHGPAMQSLVEWQRKGENVTGAIRELIEAQEKLGFMLSIVRKD